VREPPARRAGVAVPVLFALVALAIFIALGTWQIERKAWKEALIDTLERRLSAPAVELPPPERWAGLDPGEHEYRRVRLSAALLPGAEALVYGSGSALRSDVSGPGYWIFAPVRIATGGLVLVNRGFVPQERRDPASRPEPGPAGYETMVGALRWPQPRGYFVPADEPARNLWFVRDPGAIAAAKGWGEVAPFYVELETPQPAGGLPRAGAMTVSLRNEHLQYALTWYALAAVVVVMLAIWLTGRRARPS
jgi:surfeit locus 1 family protein